MNGKAPTPAKWQSNLNTTIADYKKWWVKSSRHMLNMVNNSVIESVQLLDTIGVKALKI
jgi:hypothetical protein